MYHIDLTHPSYFNQMKKVELSEKTKQIKTDKNTVSTARKIVFSVAALIIFYFTALFGLVYCFLN